MNMLERIRDLCLNRGITIAELERKADLGNGSIRRWGIAYPSVDKVDRVARVLNVSIEYLYTGENQNTPNAAARKLGKLEPEEVKAVNDLIDFYIMRKGK